MAQCGIVMRVGIDEGDIVGNTHKALQAAVDYVGALGGGIVDIGPGTYDMRDSLHLRAGVTVRGAGGETILRKCAGVTSPLATDGDYGEEQITVVDPTGFDVGCGVSVGFNRHGNFHTTVATITGQIDDNTFLINQPLLSDYTLGREATAQTTFPVISGYHITGAVVEDIAIDGNRENNPYLGGCRGGGILLYRAHGTQIRRVIVDGYHGDGISYQQSDDVLVEECTVTRCSEKGLHPGSGSGRTIVRRCRAAENDQIGLFLCWRVRHSRFEENTIEQNGLTGISIGHKDSDNHFRYNTVKQNGRYGVLFRNEPKVLAGHRNRFERNHITDNGDGAEGYGFYIDGETEGTEIVGNTIGNTDRKNPRQLFGIYVTSRAGDVFRSDNTMKSHSRMDVVEEAKSG